MHANAEPMARRAKPKPEPDADTRRIRICEADLFPPRRGEKPTHVGHVWEADAEGVIID